MNAVFEVFMQRKAGDGHDHVGSVEAPDAETALLVAKEHFARRLLCAGLWVVNREHIHEAPWTSATLSSGHEKAYRRSTGFKSSTLDILNEAS